MKYLLSIVAVIVLCISILFISLVRATLPTTMEKIRDNEYRSVLLALKPIYADENIETTIGSNYNLPDAGILPNNPFYGFKALRDWIWLRLTFDPSSKAKLLQHNADKKMAEAVAFIADSKTKDAYQAIAESFSFLEDTRQAIGNIDKKQADRAKQQELQLIRSGQAYEKIITGFQTSVTNSEYDRRSEWLDRLKKWNESFVSEED